MLLLLDDCRTIQDVTSLKFKEKNNLPPFTKKQQDIIRKYIRKYVLVKDYDEFVSYLNEKGLPQMIMFDHDLGNDFLTGYDCLKYVCQYSMDNQLGGFEAYFHSMNYWGRRNMEQYYNNFMKYCLTD